MRAQCSIQPPPRHRLFALRSAGAAVLLDAGYWVFLAVALALTFTGCATSDHSGASTTTLIASGDPGVTVRVQSTVPGVPEQVANVPAELQFTGGKYELRCVHGPQPGKLRLIANRNGIRVSTGDTERSGEVTVFRIRPTEISVAIEPPASRKK